MNLNMLVPEAKAAIMADSAHSEFVKSMDSVQFDATSEGYDVLGYKYDENGILEYIGAMSFPMPKL